VHRSRPGHRTVLRTSRQHTKVSVALLAFGGFGVASGGFWWLSVAFGGFAKWS
jgi:hypothetical protein